MLPLCVFGLIVDLLMLPGRGRLTQVLSDLGVEPLIYYSGLASRPTVIEAITVINSKSVITVNTAAG